MKDNIVYSIRKISSGNLKLLALLSLLMNLVTVINSAGQTTSAPFILKNGDSFIKHIYLSYREQDYTYNVFSFKFRITPQGKFDTLYAYENNAHKFANSVRSQLTKLNGQWNIKSLPKNKWVIMRFYVAGYLSTSDSCTSKLTNEFVNAYKREAELFLCGSKGPFGPYECITPYLVAKDYVYYPPFLSIRMR